MSEALRWWLTFEALGLLGLPLCGLVFGCLPDRGYSLSRPFAWLFAAWIAWMYAALHLSPLDAGTGRWAVIIVGMASLVALAMNPRAGLAEWRRFFAERWRYVLAIELAFAASFGAIVLLRSYMPAISGTEKPMEYMLLQTVSNSGYMPPEDLWMSGYTVNYYYFGYVMNDLMAQLSGVALPYGFNLSLAGIWGVTFVALAGLAYNAVAMKSDSGFARGAAAVLAPVLALIIGNPDATLTVWNYVRHGQQFDFSLFWDPSRVIYDRIPGRTGPQQTINEFPAFSFLLGDLHPHVLAMPLFAVGMATSLALMKWVGTSWRRFAPTAVFAGCVCGWLYMTNTWDTPAIGGLCVLAPVIGLKCGHWRERVAVLGLTLVTVVVVAVLVALPFIGTYHAPVFLNNELAPGIASIPVLSRVGHVLGLVWWDHTDVGEFLKVWGVQALMVACGLAVCARYISQKILLATSALTIVLIVAVFVWGAPVLLLLAVAMLCLAVCFTDLPLPVRWAFLLAAGAWFLVFLPEVVYLRDAFDDRMNTIFKFYFQAWQLLAVVCAVLAVALVPRIAVRLGGTRRLWVAAPVVALVIAASFAYPIAAGKERVRDNGGYQGLDGVAFLRQVEPEAYQAVQWLDANTDPGTVVLEAVGGDYTLYSRLSTYSGRPTVMGWAGHEGQWRPGQPEVSSQIGVRVEDVKQLYGPGEAQSKLALLRKYHVRYAYYGGLEREMQAKNNLPVEDPFRGLLQPEARFGDSVLYRVPGS